jgi:hypothetical protein
MAQQRPPPVARDRRRWPARLAQLTLAVSVCLWAAAAALGYGRPRVAGVASFGSSELVASLVLLTFVGVGTLIVTRRPGNRIGWLFCAIGLPVLLGSFATQYAVAALLAGWPALPAGQAMAWLAGWVTIPGVSLFFYLLVLFPDGRLPSRRWRPVAWLYGGALAVGIATAAVQQVVDRRFNRRRYDAAAAIAAFSARPRQQLDLEALTAEMLDVVDQTMEPTTVSLWLRPSVEHP